MTKKSKSITNELVRMEGQQAFTTSLIVAEGCDNKPHEYTMRLIRKYQTEFEELGSLRFENGEKVGKQGQQTVHAILNEDQATFLVTLFRNTPTVVAFKLRLVKEFRKALDIINANFANPPRAGLIQDKRSAHHPMMDALVDLRTSLGKETTTVHFMCENKLCNGVVTGNFKSADEKALSNTDVVLLAEVRRMNQSMLQMDMPYDERKKKLVAFATKRRTKLISQ